MQNDVRQNITKSITMYSFLIDLFLLLAYLV
jgi:hypothetical protein